MTIQFNSSLHFLTLPKQSLLPEEQHYLRIFIPDYARNSNRLVGKKIMAIRQDSDPFFKFLSNVYGNQLHDRKLLTAKEFFLPEDQRANIRSFKELEAYLTKSMYDLNKEDLLYLDLYLYGFKVVEDDLYSILGDSPFYTIINVRDYIRDYVNRTIEPFVNNLRRNIQKAYFCKHFEAYLSSLSQEQLNQVTEETLFKTCKSSSRHFHTNFISDKDLKRMIKELLAFEKRKRAETIINQLTEQLKHHLFEISKDELSRLTPGFLINHYDKKYGSILELTSKESYSRFKDQVTSLLTLTTKITTKLEKYLCQIPDDRLSQPTFEKSLFDLCKGYVKNSRTHSISDERTKRVTEKLLASEKSKRAKTIFRRLIKQLKDYLDKISNNDLSQLTSERLFRNYERNYGSTLELTSKESYDSFKSQVAYLLSSKKAKQTSSPEELKCSSSPGF